MDEATVRDELAMGDLNSFLTGFLHCRAQPQAPRERVPGGVLVTYVRPMRRSRELYLLAAEAGALRGFAPRPDDWVTVIGALAEPPWPSWLDGMVPTTHEFVMAALLPLRARARADGVVERGTAADIAALHARGEFPPIEPGLAGSTRATLLVARDGDRDRGRDRGEIGAIGRWGWGEGADIVVDRMATHARFRRRGLATAILAAASAAAHRAGARRALLFASQMGRPVYEAVGFTVAAPVTIFVPRGAHTPAAQ